MHAEGRLVLCTKREEIEFWNGVLKGLLAAEGELDRVLKEAEKTAAEGVKMSMTAVRDLRRRVERLHGDSLRESLRRLGE